MTNIAYKNKKKRYDERKCFMTQYRIIIQGRVQGVGFRHFALRTAKSLGIKGFVQNKADGSVFILAESSKPAFELFCDILRQGNSYSQVRHIEIEEMEVTDIYHDFEIR
ncbi:MAG: acylphosphatase [Methanoculleus sp.]